MSGSRTLTYLVPFLGILLFSAGIGGAVVGGYGAVEEELGLCGNPIISVTPPEKAAPLSASGERGPAFPRLAYGELSVAEKHAFEEALESPHNEGKVRVRGQGEFPHTMM